MSLQNFALALSQLLLGVKMAQRKTENNAYAKFGVQTKSIMICIGIFWSGQSEFNHVVTFEGRSKPKYVLVEKIDIIVLPA